MSTDGLPSAPPPPDADDFEVVLAASRDSLCQLARQLVAARDVEDVVQVAMTNVWRAWQRGVQIEFPVAYLRKAIANSAHDHNCVTKRRSTVPLDRDWDDKDRPHPAANLPAALDISATVSSIIDMERALERIRSIVGERGAQILRLTAEGYTDQEIGLVLGIERWNQIKMMRRRALRKLDKAGFDEDLV